MSTNRPTVILHIAFFVLFLQMYKCFYLHSVKMKEEISPCRLIMDLVFLFLFGYLTKTFRYPHRPDWARPGQVGTKFLDIMSGQDRSHIGTVLSS